MPSCTFFVPMVSGRHNKDQTKSCYINEKIPEGKFFVTLTHPTSLMPSSSSSSNSGAALTFHCRFFGFFDSKFTESPATCLGCPRLEGGSDTGWKFF